jgi:hypothetical protein
MDILGSKVRTYTGRSTTMMSKTCTAVRKAQAHEVPNYWTLAKKVAALQFYNRDFVLLFRGQAADYRNKQGNTSIKPSLLRGNSPIDLPTNASLAARFSKLERAEKALVAEYDQAGFAGLKRLQRQRILRWAILQHYQVCDTPLLDVTQSLRIAASFASEKTTEQGYVLVIGVPNVSGAITASAEAGLQIVRLASVCPPTAVRPHIQEGYVVGEYPDFSTVEQKKHYTHFEMDFGRRLIAKFTFEPNPFWTKSGSFPKVPLRALYPKAPRDPLCDLADRIRARLDR